MTTDSADTGTAPPLRRKRRLRRTAVRLALLLLLLSVIVLLLPVGCAMLTPLPKRTSVDERLAAFPTKGLPLRKPVTIHWDEHMVPFIEAATDEDAAFALGMVHAHLRLGQLMMVKRLTQARLAEMLGPPLADVDASLRILDLRRAAPEIHKRMPESTRVWMAAFVAGLNAYQERMREVPHEFKVLDLKPEPWTVEDIIAIDRLGAIDLHWLSWFRLLPLRGRPEYAALLKRTEQQSAASPDSFTAKPTELSGLLSAFGARGSNTFVIHASRSRTGGALMANDPHLGITVPNTWLIVGLKCPSYHAVGLSFVGLPFIAVGRNERIAWGGTNMRAASSDFYDVSGEPAESVKTREEAIGVRWWFDRKARVRSTRIGPILSDAPLLSGYKGPPLALRWVGHEPSDEFTAMLRVMAARNWDEFRRAFATYAAPGMNMLYADVEGNIGQLMAVKLPVRKSKKLDDIVRDPKNPEHRWGGYRGPLDLPFALNPKKGYLVSANNSPVKLDIPVSHVFPPGDRVERLSSLIEGRGKLTVEDVATIQRDVASPADLAVRDALLGVVKGKAFRAQVAARHAELFAAFEGWDGRYAADSRGAVAFQAVLYHFAHAYLTERHGARQAELMMRMRNVREMVRRDLSAGDGAPAREALLAAFEKAETAFGKYPTWGDMHRLRIAHALGNAPLIGGKYRFGDYPAVGSSHTVQKTAHSLSSERTTTRYGSNARHISDLADPDANGFLLLGGQDGWIHSAAFLDQVPLWREGKYITVPLRLKAVRTRFTRKTRLGK